MRRMTAKKADGALGQILYRLESEDLTATDREMLITAGALIDQVRAHASAAKSSPRKPWLTSIAELRAKRGW